MTCANCPALLGEKQLQNSIFVEIVLLKGGYQYPECDDSKTGILLSVLVMFLKHG